MTKQPFRDTLCVITVNGLPVRIKEPTQTLFLRSSRISTHNEHLRRHYSDPNTIKQDNLTKCNLVTTLVSISRSSPQVVGWNDKIGVRFLPNASRITLKTTSLPSTRYRGLPLVVTRRRVSWPIKPFNRRDCRVCRVDRWHL